VEAPASPSPAPAPSEQTTQPTTSAVEPGKTPSKESILDAVLKVVPATNETDVLAEPKDKPLPEGDPTKAAEQAEADKDDDTPADDEVPQDATPKARKQIRKLLKERRELHDEVVTLRPAAEIGVELETFAKVNSLTGDAIATGLKAMAMLRAGDYEGFYKAVAPAVRQAQEYLGIVLPKDLGELVRAQQMTEAVARNIARQRYDGQRTQAELETTQQAHSQQVVEHTRADVRNQVSSFELRLAANDPDYKVKAPFIKRAAQAMLLDRGGVISSAQEAMEITKAAYAEVNRQLKSMQPTPTATRALPNGSAQTPSGTRAAPKTMFEAALVGLENARRQGG